MMANPGTLALVALLSPVLSFLVLSIVFPLRRLGRPAAWFSILCAAVAFASAVMAWRIQSVAAHPVHLVWPWLPSAGKTLADVGVFVDAQSSIMLCLVSLVALLVQFYSVGYLHDEPAGALGRYYAYQSLFAFSMMGLALAPNLLQLFMCWELVGLCSYLLIGYWYQRESAARAAVKAFWITKAGDVGLLVGIVMLWRLTGTFDLAELHSLAATNAGPLAGLSIITFCIYLGAMGKSAQFPIHLWLPGSLFAPTPVHALLHAGIINAGGFLINRLAPLFALSSTTLHVAFVIGTLTAILGATTMLAQNDIKKTLGFSTIGQMGYMIMECGLGAFSLAVFHLIAHGLFKATVFLNCGNVIHKARQEPHFPHVDHQTDEEGMSRLTWITGSVTTLLTPLFILLLTHGVLRIPLLESQGTVIFLFFIWITSSQAILTLTRLRQVASWKVSAAMLMTLLFVVFVYLFAVESFTAFLYPDPEKVASYFKAAALPDWLFDLIILAATILMVASWSYLYLTAHGRTLRMPAWIDALRIRLYLPFMNRLYGDELHQLLGDTIMRWVHQFDKRERGWSR